MSVGEYWNVMGRKSHGSKKEIKKIPTVNIQFKSNLDLGLKHMQKACCGVVRTEFRLESQCHISP
jgi:hypothetical protein